MTVRSNYSTVHTVYHIPYPQHFTNPNSNLIVYFPRLTPSESLIPGARTFVLLIKYKNLKTTRMSLFTEPTFRIELRTWVIGLCEVLRTCSVLRWWVPLQTQVRKLPRNAQKYTFLRLSSLKQPEIFKGCCLAAIFVLAWSCHLANPTLSGL